MLRKKRKLMLRQEEREIREKVSVCASHRENYELINEKFDEKNVTEKRTLKRNISSRKYSGYKMELLTVIVLPRIILLFTLALVDPGSRINKLSFFFTKVIFMKRLGKRDSVIFRNAFAEENEIYYKGNRLKKCFISVKVEGNNKFARKTGSLWLFYYINHTHVHTHTHTHDYFNITKIRCVMHYAET